MTPTRTIGAVGAVLLMLGVVLVRRRGSLTRGEALGWLSLAGALLGVSLLPSAVNPLSSLLQLGSRVTGLLVLSVIGLFAIRMRDVRRIVTLEERLGALVRSLTVGDFRKTNPTRRHDQLISVVIAAFNEEEAIDGVLRELPRELGGYTVEPIVVVDGGTDGTERVVRRGGHLVATHPINRGHGDALRTGFQIALERGAAIVVTMDADGQHQPGQLIDLVKPIIARESDHVQGSRFLGAYDQAGSVRHAGILFFTRLINLLTGLGITDSTNGYRAFRASTLGQLRLEEDRFPVAEILIESANRGIPILEVPVHVTARSFGDSKKPKKLRYPIGFLATVLRTWLRGERSRLP